MQANKSSNTVLGDAQQVEVDSYLKITLLLIDILQPQKTLLLVSNIRRGEIRPSGHIQASGTQILRYRISWCLPWPAQGT